MELWKLKRERIARITNDISLTESSKNKASWRGVSTITSWIPQVSEPDFASMIGNRLEKTLTCQLSEPSGSERRVGGVWSSCPGQKGHLPGFLFPFESFGLRVLEGVYITGPDFMGPSKKPLRFLFTFVGFEPIPLPVQQTPRALPRAPRV